MGVACSLSHPHCGPSCGWVEKPSHPTNMNLRARSCLPTQCRLPPSSSLLLASTFHLPLMELRAPLALLSRVPAALGASAFSGLVCRSPYPYWGWPCRAGQKPASSFLGVAGTLIYGNDTLHL